jgi:hypothetical protein
MKKHSCNEAANVPQNPSAQKQAFDGSEWLTAGVINYARAKLGLSEVKPREWEQYGRVFSVLYEGRHYYATYQLDSSYEPLPIIKPVLEAYGEYSNSWELAVWFHFPNGWIANETGAAPTPLAPKDAVNLDSQLVNAARNRRGTYIA